MKKIIALVIALVLMVSLLSVAGFAAEDTTPPVITKIEGESASIGPGVKYSMNIAASDDAGFEIGFIGEVHFVRIKESEQENGAFFDLPIVYYGEEQLATDHTIGEDEPYQTGTYYIEYVELKDKNGNKTRIESKNDPNHLIPDIRLKITTKWNDLIPPEIHDVEAKSQTLKPGDQFQVTVYATDNGEFAPDVPGSSYVALVCNDGELHMDDPDLIKAYPVDQGDGRLVATFTVGEDWEPGEYTISLVQLWDSNYNLDQLFNDHGSSSEAGDIVFTVIGKNDTVAPPRRPFEDVPVGTWYTGAVKWVNALGWMSGTGDNKFSPNATVTRGMIAQILYARDRKPPVSGTSKFTDVKAGKWYANAVNWAAENGLVSGYGDGLFKPEAPITREQLIAILYKYAEKDGFDLSATADLSKYPDQGKISKWAVTAMKWGVANGIISGTNNGIEPQGNASRAQIAVILRAFERLRPEYVEAQNENDSTRSSK